MPVSDHCLTRRRPWMGRQWNQCLLGLLNTKEAFPNQPTMLKQNPAAANMDIHGYSLLQSPALASARKRADGLVYAYMFSYPNFHTYWLRLQTKALAPCLRTNSGNCWTLLEDYQNTIMYLRLTHTSSFHQGGSMPPIQTSQLCEDSLQAPVYHKHWPLSRSNDDLHILGMGQNSRQQQGASPFLSKWLGSPLQVAVRHKCTKVPQQDTAASGRFNGWDSECLIQKRSRGQAGKMSDPPKKYDCFNWTTPILANIRGQTLQFVARAKLSACSGALGTRRSARRWQACISKTWSKPRLVGSFNPLRAMFYQFQSTWIISPRDMGWKPRNSFKSTT